MDKKFLNNRVMFFICPFCGRWHEVGEYDFCFKDTSVDNPLKPVPPFKMIRNNVGECRCVEEPMYKNYELYVQDDKLYYNIQFECEKNNISVDGSISIKNISFFRNLYTYGWLSCILRDEFEYLTPQTSMTYLKAHWGESPKAYMGVFDVYFYPNVRVGPYDCRNCHKRDECCLLKFDREPNCQLLRMTLGFIFFE